MRYLALTIALIITLSLYGQDHPVKGKVIDESGLPLSKVNIIICREMRSGTSSNEEGNFHIYCRPGDTLQFSHLGYETVRVRVNEKLWQPDQQELKIIMKPVFLNLKQFTLTEKRDRSLKYLLDFDVVQGHILKLEIHGSQKVLFLCDMNDREYWRCLLPEHAMDCSRLTRDFVNNVYLQSKDSKLIFDHTINRILVMNPEGELLSSTSIFYNNKEFLQKYIVDDNNLTVAGVFKNRKGIYLQFIDPFTGKPLEKTKELDCLFYEKVRLLDGIAVYLTYDHIRNKRTLAKSFLL